MLCLSKHSATCITAQDVEGAIEAAAAAIGAAYVIYKWITGRGDDTPESKGDNDGSNSPPDAGDASAGLCLAAAPTQGDGNNRVFYTSNCFGNKYASWKCHQTSKFDCQWLSVAALDEHRSCMITEFNLRNYAYTYVKPSASGTWQEWTIFGP